MEIRLLYFDGCPHWRVADERLSAAVRQLGIQATTERVRVETTEAAEAWGFHGSPSILIDGRDAFADPGTPVGLTCRLYPTPTGPQGAPTIGQLVQALGHDYRAR